MQWVLIILCKILLQDFVQSSFGRVLNDQYVDQQYIPIPNDQSYSYPYAWTSNPTNMYDYTAAYTQQQEQQQQQQQQFGNDFQAQQQFSAQYQYPQYLQTTSAAVNQPQLTVGTGHYDARPLIYYSGQEQTQTQNKMPPQYTNFQEQYQTNQAIHPDGRQYENYQYQYQDGTQQTQEQHILSDSYRQPQRQGEVYLHSSGTQNQLLEPQTQPTPNRKYNTQNYETQTPTSNAAHGSGDTLYVIPINGPSGYSASDFNLDQNENGDSQYQEPYQYSMQYNQLQYEIPLKGPPFSADIKVHSYITPIQMDKLKPEFNQSAPLDPVDNSKSEDSQKPALSTIITTISNSDANISLNTTKCYTGLQGLLAQSGNCSKFFNDNKNTGEVTPANEFDVAALNESPQTLENFCINKTYGAYGHPFDCSKLVNCSHKGQLEMDCALGRVFNVKTMACAPVNEVQCITHRTAVPSQGILCPNGVFGQFPYPFNSELFINCSNAGTIVESCPPNTTFSPSKSYCEVTLFKLSCTGKELLQQLQTHPVLLCPTSCDGSHLYPFDSTKYILCQNGRLQIMSCASSDVFSVSKGVCVNRYQTDLFDRVRSITNVQPVDSEILQTLYKQFNRIVCPIEVLGVFPYPFANTKYFKCVDGRILIKHCRSGFLYSISRRLCDIPDHILSFDTAVPIKIVTSAFDDRGGVADNGAMTVLKCPLGVNDNFVFPFLNTRYTKCADGVTAIQTCLNGAIYSIRQKRCLPHSQVDSNDYIEHIATSLKRFANDHTLGVSCRSKVVHSFAHPDDRRKYVICQKGNIVVKKCRGNTFFSIMQQKCV